MNDHENDAHSVGVTKDYKLLSSHEKRTHYEVGAIVKLTIGDIVQRVTFKNTFELNIEYMYGDADGDTNRIVYYEDVDELKQDLAVFARIGDDDIDDVDLEEIFTQLGVEDAAAAQEAFIDAFYEEDITRLYDERWASFAGLSLYYWDENSVKYEVSISVDGQTL